MSRVKKKNNIYSSNSPAILSSNSSNNKIVSLDGLNNYTALLKNFVEDKTEVKVYSPSEEPDIVTGEYEAENLLQVKDDGSLYVPSPANLNPSSNVYFTMAEVKENVQSGEKLSIIIGKVAKWFASLDKVGNFKAVSTESNQGLTSSEQANARTNISAPAIDSTGRLILGNFRIGYNSTTQALDFTYVS